jgi:hypothetical protein
MASTKGGPSRLQVISATVDLAFACVSNTRLGVQKDECAAN